MVKTQRQWIDMLALAGVFYDNAVIGVLFRGLAVFLHSPGATCAQRMIDNELKKHT